ncbi:MAG: hypothetical protein BWY22_02511 [Bacteroidetes bacterium ADurb.Bin217]|nr:MAG: hypothetical protein BWY22_02511 [Bacteroidetes bacterium ADurb.Bin217]
MGKSVLRDKSFDLAKKIVLLHKEICENKKEFVISKQILRSGTAVGALIREAEFAESNLDFIHKFAIAQKECNETLYWLDLLLETEYITKTKYDAIYTIAYEILKMLISTINTLKKKRK